MIDYTVMGSESLSEVTDFVKTHMALGWVPQGGIFIKSYGIFSPQIIYYQAMVK